jgi:single-strand DNA-binding protein
MSDLKMPEVNNVIIAGNLTKDPVYRQTSNNTPVVNFSIASNRKYRDGSNSWQEDVCYVGVVAWNRLAESCRERLKKVLQFWLMVNFKAESGKPKKVITEVLLK